MGIREWLRRRRLDAEARRLVAGIFEDPELLRGTSLSSRHRARWVLLDHEIAGDRVISVTFGILRHPRPYAFSRQSHKVIEYYRLEIEPRRLTRLAGRNVTREGGEDADGS